MIEAPPDERKLATLLFVDLVGSTELGERLDPERLRAMLATYFAAVSTTITSWGGTVEKYIGDAVVAVFGVPRVREDDATRAVSAAREILDAIVGLNADLERRGVPALAVRIGVNTGEVVAPTEIRPDRALVVGDAVNVAARLEQAAGPGEVIVGERTAQLAAGSFRFDDPVEFQLKGKSASVRARRLLGPADGGADAAGGRVLRARMIGRDGDLATLESVFKEAVEGGQPRLALIVGPAGIGKSRLVREFQARSGADRPDSLALRGRCPAAGQGASLWPFAEIVRGVCGLSLDDSAAETATRLQARIGEICVAGGMTQQEAELTTSALATTAGITIAGNPLEEMRAGIIATEIARQWPRFLSALAVGGPLVVVIEDLHWASDIAIDLIQAIVARGHGPLLVVATARPEFVEAHPTIVAHEDATALSLRPLGAGASDALLEALLPEAALSAELRETLLSTAEGNPLFLEELLARLIDVGQLVQSDGGWKSKGSTGDVALPDTIQGVLAARIDALEADEKRVLQEAAVVGRVFWEPPVAMAVGAESIAEPLSRLERRGMVLLRPTSSLAGHDEYLIKHALVRDVAYNGLPRARRGRAHASVADWLVGISRDRPEELAELVAWHWAAAIGDGSDLAWDGQAADLLSARARAFPALLAGGAAARKRYAVQPAVEFHEAALRLAATDGDRARTLEEIGDDHDIGYHGDLAVPAWSESLALLRDDPTAAEARARLAYKAAYMGTVRWGGFKQPMDPAEIDRLIDLGLLAAGDDPTARGRLLAVRAGNASRWASFGRSDPVSLDERGHDGEEAEAIAHAAGDAFLETLALRGLIGVRALEGDAAGAVEASRREIVSAGRLEAAYSRHLFTMIGANAISWLAGEFEPMLVVFQDLLASSRELEPHDALHSTFCVMACLYYLGRWDELLAVLDEHERTFALEEDMACPYVRGGMMVGALTAARRGDPERARALIAKVPVTEAPVGLVEGLQAMTLVAVGDTEAGRRLAGATLGAGRRNFAEEPPVELLALLEALAADGDAVEAAAIVAAARARAGELALLGPAADLAEGRLDVAAGDPARAAALFGRAIEGFDRVSVYDAARAREALASVPGADEAGLLAATLETYTRLGAASDADRVRARGSPNPVAR